MIRKLAWVGAALWLLLSALLRAEPVEAVQARLQLISESDTIVPGEVFHLAVRFEMDPHWHIYWENPGASGLPPEITWDLPEGFEVGAMQFPAPERIEMAGLMSYAYEDVATFVVPIQAPDELAVGTEVSIGAEVFYLICKDVCLPGDAALAIELVVSDDVSASEDALLFEAARSSQPEKELPFLVSVSAVHDGKMVVAISELPDGEPLPSDLYFYSVNEAFVDANAPQPYVLQGGFAELELTLAYGYFEAENPILQGVLQGEARSWDVGIGSAEDLDIDALIASQPQVSYSDSGGFEQWLLDVGLVGWLVLAFLGGLILNVMPCVLPVLSIKVFSLLNHAGDNRAHSLAHGVAYTLGVVASFLVLAGALFALRFLGESIGWGFQLQNPGFVLVLALVFFLFGLNLLGVFEVGAGLVGADTKVAGRKDLIGSFGVGVLAAVVGAPCIGPLVSGVSGVAIQADPLTGLLIFGMMGFGMASPFLVLAALPKLVAYLPKPGNWMVVFKQLMGFLLMASVVFLIYLMGQLAGLDGVMVTLIVIFIGSVVAWVFGSWGAVHRSAKSKAFARLFVVVGLVGSLAYGMPAIQNAYGEAIQESAPADDSDTWKPWSVEAVQAELASGKPVFIDFTATWCLICQVNKKAALRTEATTALFAEYEVATFSADWTRYDSAITEELERYGRSGVPLYLLYHPSGEVRVLPQNLTNGIVAEAVEDLLGE